MNRTLTDCTTAVDRLEWVRHRLGLGHTVTEAGLEMGGVTSPAALIAGLRATGMEIETLRISRVDLNGKKHTGCVAWRLLPPPMGREAARTARQGCNAMVPEHGKAA